MGNGSSSTYTVDDNDKFLTGDGFTASSYDNDGNPGTLNWQGRGNYVFTYDKEQRPTSTLSAGPGTWTHTYDGEGRRVKLVSPSGERRYVFDGATVIAESDSGGTILTYHIPDVGWIEGGTQRFYRQNGLGSNLSVLDTSGAKVSESEFDGYGNEYTVQAGPQNQFGFAGKHGYQMDSNDLQLLGARFYVAPLGRFLTQDPIGQEGGLNLYAYCDNNPLSNIDPDGKTKIVVFWYDVAKVGHHSGILIIDNSKGYDRVVHSFAGGPERYGIYNNGKLVSKSGPWRAGTQDYDMVNGKWENTGVIVHQDNVDTSYWINLYKGIEAEMRSIASPDYVFTGWGRGMANSNSWTRELLERGNMLRTYDKAIRKRGGNPTVPGWATDAWPKQKKK